MTPPRTVVFDNEAIQALADPAHRKHRSVLAFVEAITARNKRRVGSTRLVVPTAVRVEAGWDRRVPQAASINRLRLDDVPLDSGQSDRAASVRTALRVSVADAHVAAVLESTPEPHAVVTSDVDDLARIAAHLDLSPTIVRL